LKQQKNEIEIIQENASLEKVEITVEEVEEVEVKLSDLKYDIQHMKVEKVNSGFTVEKIGNNIRSTLVINQLNINSYKVQFLAPGTTYGNYQCLAGLG